MMARLMIMVAFLTAIPSARADAWTADGVTLVARPELIDLAIAGDGTGGGLALYVAGYGPNALILQRFMSDGSRASTWPADGVALDPEFGGWRWLIPDGAGGAFVSWRRLPPDHAIVTVQHILGDGTRAPGWPDTGAVAVDGSIGPAFLRLATDGAGGVFVAWQDFRVDYGRQVVYVQHIDAGGQVAAGWPAGGIPCADADGGQYDPLLVSDGAGGVIVVWWDGRDYASWGYDIRAQRLNGNGTMATGWPVDGALVCHALTSQQSPAICPDGAGGAFVTWADGRANATPTSLYVQHLLANGHHDPFWLPDGTHFGFDAFLNVPPTIVTDGAGGAFVSWTGGPQGSAVAVTRITHVLPGGTVAPGWPAGGALLSDEPNIESSSLVEDGASGVIAVIVKAVEFRGSVVRLQPDGTVHPQWSAPVEIDWPYSSFAAPVVSDGSGGAILGWLQYGTSPDSRVRIQRVTGDAVVAPGWTGYPGAWLGGAAPNPAAGAASIRFALPSSGPATLALFDLHGRRVRTLFDGAVLAAGQHAVPWDGRDHDGRPAPAGIYFMRLDAGPVRETRRLVVAR